MMKEKKQPKFLWVTTLFLLIPLCINKIIFAIAQKRDPYKDSYDSCYTWKYGKIHYREKGHGKPLLLIHSISIGAGSHEWEPCFETLAENYHVYSIDLLGFGYSEKPKMTYTAYLFTSLINDFIANVIQKPCAVIASNESADFAIMACRLQPAHYKKMILVSPTGITAPIATNDDQEKRKVLECPVFGALFYVFLSSYNHIKQCLGEKYFFAKEKWVKKELIQQYYYAAHYDGENARYAIASYQTNFMNIDIQDGLRALRLPLYFVWGENNHDNPIKAMEQIEKIKPRAYYAIFEKTRCLPHYENTPEFITLAKDFLR